MNRQGRRRQMGEFSFDSDHRREGLPAAPGRLGGVNGALGLDGPCLAQPEHPGHQPTLRVVLAAQGQNGARPKPARAANASRR